MSARTRGIILQQEGEALIIQASLDEVQRFGQGQPVAIEELGPPQFLQPPPTYYYHTASAEGWMQASTSSGAWAYGAEYGAGGYAQAFVKLRTRCGCERTILKPHPLPNNIKIAMWKEASLIAQPVSETPSMLASTRVFEYKGKQQDGLQTWYLYEERE